MDNQETPKYKQLETPIAQEILRHGFTHKAMGRFFTLHRYFNLKYLKGHKFYDMQIILDWPNDTNWCKIEVLFCGESEYETMFEGGIDTPEQFSFVMKLILQEGYEELFTPNPDED